MARPLHAKRLGWQNLIHGKTTNLETFLVRVRRQDSTIKNVMLMDELTRFTEKEMPEAVNKYLAYPQSIQYDQEALKHIQGFPEEVRTKFSCPAQNGPKDREQMLKEAWRKRAEERKLADALGFADLCRLKLR